MANTEVGTAYVAIIPSAKGFAKTLQKAIAEEFADSKLDKMITDALGGRKPVALPIKPVIDPKSVPDKLPATKKPIKLPVTPEIDPKSIPDKVPTKPGKQPKLPVVMDPLLADFQATVKRGVTALAKEINLKVPASADKAALRSDLAATVAALEKQLNIQVPTEPGGRREYETKLRAMLAEAQQKVKATVDVEPKADRNRFSELLHKISASDLVQGLTRAFSAVQSAASSAVGAVGQFTGAAASMVGSIGGVVGPLIGLAAVVGLVVAAFATAGPAIYLLGGALGSLPGLAAGASAGIGALALGFRGVADAFKETASGAGTAGQSAAAAARQIASAQRGIVSAERGVARAQREARDAQEGLNRARKTAKERIEDLARSLTGARLDEREAALRVRDAEKELAEARRTGNTDDIEHAQLAYEQAAQALDLARDSTADLADEQADAAKRGVEGSDEVQAALQRQTDSMESVSAAADSLTAAHEQLAAAQEKTASGGGALADVIALAPAAQKFVDAVKGLKPAFESLRLGVQEKLFSGLDGTVKRLATQWFPQLNTTLGNYATTFNGLIKSFASSIGQKSFIDNFAAGAEASRKALARIGSAVSGPLVDAFGRLSKAASPFIEALGDEVAKLVEDFSSWIAAADKSGKLNDFFAKASGFLRDVFDMGRDVGSIFGSIAEILFGANEDAETSPWEGLKNKLDDLAKWFDNPENQEKVRGWIQKIQEFFDNFINVQAPKIQDMLGKVDGWIQKVDLWATRIGWWKDLLTGGFGAIVELVTGSVRRMSSAIDSLNAPVDRAIGFFSRMRAGITEHINSAVNAAMSIPGRITNAVGSLGTLLYNAGKSLINGLVSGIFAAIPQLSGALGYVTNFIRNNKGPIEKDRRLLIPAGAAIMEGLIGGIHAERSALAAELAGVTSDITVGGNASAGVAGYRAPAAPDPAQLSIKWEGGTGDAVVKGLRDHIRVYYSGSPDKALRFGGR